MVAQIASYSSLNLVHGVTARAVAPVAVAPMLADRPAHHADQPPPSTVALAPAAMSALIEAQERLSQNAPVLVRQHTAQKIDHLIVRLDGSDANGRVPFAIRQLQAARDALSLRPIDLQA